MWECRRGCVSLDPCLAALSLSWGTAMPKIHPLIICGGNGTRLWPVSRTESPKQFQRIGDATSPTFFQSAIERHQGADFEIPVIVASERHARTVETQLAQIGSDAQIIHEPMGRNTGPAVLAAAMRLYQHDPEALMLVIPADHVIEGDLNSTIVAMKQAAQDGHIITFGIKPRYPETGFGYITDGGAVDGYPGLRKVERFVEKPPARKARFLVESDIAYWASGISMFSAATIIEEYKRFDMRSYVAVENAVLNAAPAPRGVVLSAEHFRQAAAEPTEQVVFEKTRRIALAPLDVMWNDVGSWSAMYGIQAPNAEGNVLQGDIVTVDTHNSLVRSEGRLVTLVGMSDVIVVDTPDALLVTKVGHCQNVKKVAEHLKAAQRVEVESHQKAEREWGHLRQVIDEDAFTLSTLTIKPGAVVSMEADELREAIVVTGSLSACEGPHMRALGPGGRMVLDGAKGGRLVNDADETAEVVLMSVQPAVPADNVVPVARYA
ncbi:hypothetical protein DXV76_08315 [Rhodobacteraceae bacterium CCMM004]|nr:hypothetical protein DXV76_08315 [Rhodobacteraceae bacterium CCMM004]